MSDGNGLGPAAGENREVSLLVHVIRGAQYGFQFPRKELQDLFRIFGVKLNINDGVVLDQDPRTLARYEDLANSFRGSIGDPGHVIYGSTLLDDGSTNGLLLTKCRNCVAIFSNSNNIVDEAKLLEVCAHEIGHMLNRTHGDGDINIPTIECEADALIAQDVPSAWDKRGLPAFRGMRTFPFRENSERDFREADSSKILPYGEAFRDGDPILHGASRLGMTLKVQPEKFRWAVGGVFACIVTLRNTTNKHLTAVQDLDPTVGYLVLEIERPDGTRYVHRPRVYRCGDHAFILKAGRSLQQPFVLVDGPGYSIFSEPGVYRVRASLPRVGSLSRWVKIAVRRDPRRAFDRSFAKFLVSGASAVRSRHWRTVNAQLATHPRRGDPLRPYLALLKARRLDKAEEKAMWLREAGHLCAPRAIRHLAAFEAAVHAEKEKVLLDCCRHISRGLRGSRLDRHLDHQIGQLKLVALPRREQR